MSNIETSSVPFWYSQAMKLIDALPHDNALDRGRAQMARQICSFIEISDIHTPRVWRERPGVICLYWSRAARELQFFVSRPGSWRCQQWKPGGDPIMTVSCGDHAIKVRRLFAWLCPGANGYSAEELTS